MLHCLPYTIIFTLYSLQSTFLLYYPTLPLPSLLFYLCNTHYYQWYPLIVGRLLLLIRSTTFLQYPLPSHYTLYRNPYRTQFCLTYSHSHYPTIPTTLHGTHCFSLSYPLLFYRTHYSSTTTSVTSSASFSSTVPFSPQRVVTPSTTLSSQPYPLLPIVFSTFIVSLCYTLSHLIHCLTLPNTALSFAFLSSYSSLHRVRLCALQILLGLWLHRLASRLGALFAYIFCCSPAFESRFVPAPLSSSSSISAVPLQMLLSLSPLPLFVVCCFLLCRFMNASLFSDAGISPPCPLPDSCSSLSHTLLCFF